MEIRGDQIKIGISAPKDVPIYRKEVYLQIQEETKEAMNVEGLEALENLILKRMDREEICGRRSANLFLHMGLRIPAHSRYKM